VAESVQTNPIVKTVSFVIFCIKVACFFLNKTDIKFQIKNLILGKVKLISDYESISQFNLRMRIRFIHGCNSCKWLNGST